VELDIDLAIYQKKPYNPESLKEMKKWCGKELITGTLLLEELPVGTTGTVWLLKNALSQFKK
jgi:hypothetical protein